MTFAPFIRLSCERRDLGVSLHSKANAKFPGSRMYELIGRRIAACVLVLGCVIVTDMACAQPTDLKISWEVRNRFRLFREQSNRLGAALKPTYIFPCDSRRKLPNMG
jgi:hypothetical protein